MKTNNLTITLISILITMITLPKMCKSQHNLVCYSKTIIHSKIIYKYFYGRSSGVYIDIEPQDSIINSETVYLRSQGWTGVNIHSNLSRYRSYIRQRNDDVNLFMSLNSQKQLIQQSSPLPTNLPQICTDYLSKPANLLSIRIQNLTSYLQNNNWLQPKCMPQSIIVDTYKHNQLITDQHINQLTQKGYTRIGRQELSDVSGDIGQYLEIFVYGPKLEEFRSRGRANWEFVKQRRVYGFGRVVGELGNRDDIKLDGNQIKNSIMGDYVYIYVCRNGQIIDIQQLTANININSNSNRNISNILIMQFNPQRSSLYLNRSQTKTQLLKIPLTSNNNNNNNTNEEMLQFYHITYTTANKDTDTNKQVYHIYVYDHQYNTDISDINGYQVLGIQKLLDNKIIIDKYDINRIDVYNRESTINNNSASQQQQQQRQQVTEMQKMEQRQKQLLEQIYRLRNKSQEQDRQIKEQTGINQELRRVKQVDGRIKYTNNTQDKKQNEVKQKTKKQKQVQKQQQKQDLPNNTTKTKPAARHPKQDIAYLTPENIFANKQMQNKTIMIIVLIASVVGSIMITAAVTACILKRRHRAHIAARIKSNHQMHTQPVSDHQSVSGSVEINAGGKN